MKSGDIFKTFVYPNVNENCYLFKGMTCKNKFIVWGILEPAWYSFVSIRFFSNICINKVMKYDAKEPLF